MWDWTCRKGWHWFGWSQWLPSPHGPIIWRFCSRCHVSEGHQLHEMKVCYKELKAPEC